MKEITSDSASRPSSFVSRFVLNDHRWEILPTNQIALAHSSLLIWQQLEEQLDVYWSMVTYFVVSFFQELNVLKHGHK